MSEDPRRLGPLKLPNSGGILPGSALLNAREKAAQSLLSSTRVSGREGAVASERTAGAQGSPTLQLDGGLVAPRTDIHPMGNLVPPAPIIVRQVATPIWVIGLAVGGALTGLVSLGFGLAYLLGLFNLAGNAAFRPAANSTPAAPFVDDAKKPLVLNVATSSPTEVDTHTRAESIALWISSKKIGRDNKGAALRSVTIGPKCLGSDCTGFRIVIANQFHFGCDLEFDERGTPRMLIGCESSEGWVARPSHINLKCFVLDNNRWGLQMGDTVCRGQYTLGSANYSSEDAFEIIKKVSLTF